MIIARSGPNGYRSVFLFPDGKIPVGKVVDQQVGQCADADAVMVSGLNLVGDFPAEAAAAGDVIGDDRRLGALPEKENHDPHLRIDGGPLDPYGRAGEQGFAAIGIENLQRLGMRQYRSAQQQESQKFRFHFFIIK